MAKITHPSQEPVIVPVLTGPSIPNNILYGLLKYNFSPLIY